ncbi:hypothetical protein TIFTF001_023577 [Ficus carica]|uniref:Homeobox-leucine zipper protein n=1 Tax=Ficus carica TaxID=3494 RepID=A0AA88AGG8_FICCA|nr:hypothetical protein TIFTF001_023577 [Ficus carica]
MNYNKSNKQKRLTQDQVRLLERSFTTSKKLEPERKLELAGELGIPPRQVAVWYQNKRARWRTQSIEIDCGALQVRLESALAEKRLLEREVDRLRGELHKAKEMLHFALECKKPPLEAPISTTTNTNTLCSISSSTSFYDNCDQDHHDYQDHVVDNQVLQFDHELYACLMGSDDDGVVYL